MEERISKERILWEAIRSVPDLQCAWQILLQSANPQANHTMRTMPPSLSAAYCVAHVEGIWSTAKGLLGGIRTRGRGSDSIQMIHQRTLGVPLQLCADCATRVHLTGVSRNTNKRQQSWTERVFGGNPVGQNFAMGSDHRRTTHVTRANGRTLAILGILCLRHPLQEDLKC